MTTTRGDWLAWLDVPTWMLPEYLRQGDRVNASALLEWMLGSSGASRFPLMLTIGCDLLVTTTAESVRVEIRDSRPPREP